MPREIPNTTWDNRTQPTTNWETDRGLKYLIQESLGKLLLESGDGALLLEDTINTGWDDPRYALYVEDLTGANVTDLTGKQVTGISGNSVNRIDTNWD